MVVGRRGQRQTEPEPNVFGLMIAAHRRAPRGRTCARSPAGSDARSSTRDRSRSCRVHDLIDGLPDDPRLGVEFVGRDEHFVEDPELHGAPIRVLVACACVGGDGARSGGGRRRGKVAAAEKLVSSKRVLMPGRRSAHRGDALIRGRLARGDRGGAITRSPSRGHPLTVLVVHAPCHWTAIRVPASSAVNAPSPRCALRRPASRPRLELTNFGGGYFPAAGPPPPDRAPITTNTAHATQHDWSTMKFGIFYEMFVPPPRNRRRGAGSSGRPSIRSCTPTGTASITCG